MSIKNKVDITRQKRHNALVNNLGMVSEIIFHSLRAIYSINNYAVLHYDLIVFFDYANNVVSSVFSLLHTACYLDISLFEIKIAKRTFKALVKQ